jgi:hypothetical protein
LGGMINVRRRTAFKRKSENNAAMKMRGDSD